MKKMTVKEMRDFISKRCDSYNALADEYYNDGVYDKSDALYINANELRKLLYAVEQNEKIKNKKMTAKEMRDFISKRYDSYNAQADEYYNDGVYDKSDVLYIIANELRKLLYDMGYNKML